MRNFIKFFAVLVMSISWSVDTSSCSLTMELKQLEKNKATSISKEHETLDLKTLLLTSKFEF